MSVVLNSINYRQPYFGFHKVGDATLSQNGKFSLQQYRFAPATFKTDWNERYPDTVIQQGQDFDSSVIYNDAAQEAIQAGQKPKRKGFHRFGVFGIKLYQLGTRFNKIPVLGWLSRGVMGSNRCYHKKNGDLSCSEMGIVMMDQLAQSGKFKDFWKACKGIKDYLGACAQGSVSKAEPHWLEKPFIRVWNWIKGRPKDAHPCDAPVLKEYTYTLKERVVQPTVALA